MPMFLNAVPQAAQSLGETQSPILQNFTTIDTAFQIDHVPYTSPNQGYHNKVTFILQTGGNLPVNVPANAFDMYLAVEPLTSTNQLYLKIGPDATSNLGKPFTFANLVAGTTLSYTYLPSGLIIQWGQSTSLASSFRNINFTALGGIAYSDANYAVIISSKRSATNVYTLQSNVNSATNFDVSVQNISGSTGNTISFTWMTIGM